MENANVVLGIYHKIHQLLLVKYTTILVKYFKFDLRNRNQNKQGRHN